MFKPDDCDTKIKFLASDRSPMSGFYQNSQGQDVHSAVHGRTVVASCCWTSRLAAAVPPRRRVATRGLDCANTRIQREKGIKDSGYFLTSDILKGGAKNVARRQHRLNLGTGVCELVFFCFLRPLLPTTVVFEVCTWKQAVHEPEALEPRIFQRVPSCMGQCHHHHQQGILCTEKVIDEAARSARNRKQGTRSATLR